MTGIRVTPPDQADRDRIVRAHDETLFVDAGAGSGKTTQLVARVVAMVASGHLPSVRALAAITFTENAATQLRTRVREALEDVAHARGTAGAAWTAEGRERCARALAELDDAAITTLHGFAARLLMDSPLEAGLPPGFRVHDAIATNIDRDRWWRRLLDEWYDDPALTELWRVGLTLDLRPDCLTAVAAAFDANWDLLIHHHIDVLPLPALDVEAVLEPLRRLVSYARGRAPASDALAVRVENVLAPLLAEAEAEPDPLQALAILAAANLKGGGNAGAWQRAGLDKVVATALLEAATLARDVLVARCRAAVTTQLAERLRLAVLHHAADRRDRGGLWFHDLLVYAVELLRVDAEVRAAMRERWTVLCVDEFQDTDPLQVELVHLIAGLDSGRWQDASVEDGRMFFVGDPKQSIYRFRRAEVALFAEVRGRYPGGPVLTQNFRSRGSVLDVVNDVFQTLLGPDPMIGYQPLTAARGAVPADPGPDVALLGGPGPAGASIGLIRETEAEHVAATLAAARGSWLVQRDKDDGGGERPAAYGDMAILVPTRTSLAQLEDALDRRDIPYRIMSRSLVWETDAVRDLVTVLQCVDDPADPVALVAALRHPMFACSDDDLVEWKAGGGTWRYDVPPPDGMAGSPVAAGMSALRAYHDLRWWLPVNVLLDRILRERRGVELTAVHRRPRDHWRRLRFLLDQARAFLDGGGTGLTGFIRWAQEQIASAADAIETVIPEQDDDAVQILTIHSSKGLEFPIVALTGINSPPRPAGPVIWPPGAAPEVTLSKGFQTPGYEAAKQPDRALDLAEELRLLYVGMTRAADHLVVSLHHKTKKGPADTHAMRLYGMLADLEATGAVHEANPPDGPTAQAAPVAAAAPPADCLDTRGVFLRQRQGLLDGVRRRLPTTATALVAAQAEAGVGHGPADGVAGGALDPAPADEPDQEPADALAESEVEPPDFACPPPLARSGATLGSAVHRTLELVDLATPDPRAVDLAVTAACAELSVPHLRKDVAGRVRAALASSFLREAAAARHWKEVPIAATVDGRIVEGVIDLVVDHGDSLTVADYKTDSVGSPADIAAKVEHYTPQLRAYARALTAATGRPVTRAVLLFCGADQAHAFDVAL